MHDAYVVKYYLTHNTYHYIGKMYGIYNTLDYFNFKRCYEM